MLRETQLITVSVFPWDNTALNFSASSCHVHILCLAGLPAALKSRGYLHTLLRSERGNWAAECDSFMLGEMADTNHHAVGTGDVPMRFC